MVSDVQQHLLFVTPYVSNEWACVATVLVTKTYKQDLINIPVEQHRLWVVTLMRMLTTIMDDTGGVCHTLTHPKQIRMGNVVSVFPCRMLMKPKKPRRTELRLLEGWSSYSR